MIAALRFWLAAKLVGWAISILPEEEYEASFVAMNDLVEAMEQDAAEHWRCG